MDAAPTAGYINQHNNHSLGEEGGTKGLVENKMEMRKAKLLIESNVKRGLDKGWRVDDA